EPVRDVVVHRALPLAERVAAGQAAPRLLRRRFGVVRPVDLRELRNALLDRQLLRIAAGNLEELQVFVAHAARLRFSIRLSMDAAFGFTTQNLPTYERKSLRSSSPHALP